MSPETKEAEEAEELEEPEDEKQAEEADETRGKEEMGPDAKNNVEETYEAVNT